MVATYNFGSVYKLSFNIFEDFLIEDKGEINTV